MMFLTHFDFFRGGGVLKTKKSMIFWKNKIFFRCFKNFEKKNFLDQKSTFLRKKFFMSKIEILLSDRFQLMLFSGNCMYDVFFNDFSPEGILVIRKSMFTETP